MFEHRKRTVLEERAKLKDELARLSTTDLPLHRAIRNLEFGNAALYSYKSGIPAEQRAIIESVTSNFELHGKNVEIALRSPFQKFAHWRKLLNGAPRRSIPRTRAKQILDIALSVAKAERKYPVINQAARSGCGNLFWQSSGRRSAGSWSTYWTKVSAILWRCARISSATSNVSQPLHAEIGPPAETVQMDVAKH